MPSYQQQQWRQGDRDEGGSMPRQTRRRTADEAEQSDRDGPTPDEVCLHPEPAGVSQSWQSTCLQPSSGAAHAPLFSVLVMDDVSNHGVSD